MPEQLSRVKKATRTPRFVKEHSTRRLLDGHRGHIEGDHAHSQILTAGHVHLHRSNTSPLPHPQQSPTSPIAVNTLPTPPSAGKRGVKFKSLENITQCVTEEGPCTPQDLPGPGDCVVLTARRLPGAEFHILPTPTHLERRPYIEPFPILLCVVVSTTARSKNIPTVVVPFNLPNSIVIPLEATWVRKE